MDKTILNRMDSYYIHNRETGKLELHFDKSEYDALTDEQRSEIKSVPLGSPFRVLDKPRERAESMACGTCGAVHRIG